VEGIQPLFSNNETTVCSVKNMDSKEETGTEQPRYSKRRIPVKYYQQSEAAVLRT
jgi:hypothetical protein